MEKTLSWSLREFFSRARGKRPVFLKRGAFFVRAAKAAAEQKNAAVLQEHGGVVLNANQNSSFSSIYLRSSLRWMRTCSIVSRSRTVTVPSSTVSKSTVMHSGVPISSSRR